jgi:hypothetical protein
MPNIFLRLKANIKSRVTNIKNGVQELKEIFKENFEEARSKPRSKRKSFVLGATTVFSIFGITLLAPVLSAVAKDLPKNPPKDMPPAPAPGPVCPTHGSKSFLSQEIGKAIIGLIGTICAKAAQNGSYGLGILCGILVSGAILKNQDKNPGSGK